MRSMDHRKASHQSEEVFRWFNRFPACTKERELKVYSLVRNACSGKSICPSCLDGYIYARSQGLNNIDQARSLPHFKHLNCDAGEQPLVTDRFLKYPVCSETWCADTVLKKIKKFKDGRGHFWVHLSAEDFREVYAKFPGSFCYVKAGLESSSMRRIKFLHWWIKASSFRRLFLCVA